MDVHRSRFVPIPSAPINAVAFSRSNDKGYSGPKPTLKLAIGRANGDIEIWNPNAGHWVQETIFYGDHGTSIDGLAWTQDPDELGPDKQVIAGQLRLFSIGSRPSVTEVNLTTGRPLRASTGNFTEVWCLAAQPRQVLTKQALIDAESTVDSSFQHIIAGCGDGTLALLSTADNDLEFKRFMARSGSKKTRCMSVIWQNAQRVVAGFNDSTIRIYDIRNGSLLRNMSTGAGIPGAPKDTLVWKVKTLPNGDIVSADSNGEIRFWDGKNYNLVQRITGHTSDCLDLITSSDGQVIFSGGMDGRLAIYKLAGHGDRRHWAKIAQRRLHTGDIKTMAVHDSKSMSTVVTGGHDASPTVTPLKDYGRAQHWRIPGLRHSNTCVSVPSQRLVVCWWEQTVYIWRIAKQQRDDHVFDSSERSRKLVSQIIIAGHESITSVGASSDGRLIVIGTTVATKAFSLRPASNSDGSRLRVNSLILPTSVSAVGAKLVNISPDCRWLSVVNTDNEIIVARIIPADSPKAAPQIMSKTVELDRGNHKYSLTSALSPYDGNVVRAAFSPDGCAFVVGDVSGYLDAWVLRGDYDATAPATEVAANDSSSEASSSASSGTDSDSDSSDDEDEKIIYHGQHWTDLPSNTRLLRLDSAPLVLSFRPVQSTKTTTNGSTGLHATRSNPHPHSHARPASTPILFVMTQTHGVYEFDLLTGSLTDWSRRNPTSVMPSRLTVIKDRVKGLIWEIQHDNLTGAQRERAWLYGASWLAMLDVSQDFTSHKDLVAKHVAEQAALAAAHGTKRRASDVRHGSGINGVEQGSEESERKRRRAPLAHASRVPDEEMHGLVMSTRQTRDGLTVEVAALVDNDDDSAVEDSSSDDDDDDDDDDAHVELGPLIRLDAGSPSAAAAAVSGASITTRAAAAAKDVNGSGPSSTVATSASGSAATVSRQKRRKFFVTFKYKPILGVVALTTFEQMRNSRDQAAAVAVGSTTTASNGSGVVDKQTDIEADEDDDANENGDEEDDKRASRKTVLRDSNYASLLDSSSVPVSVPVPSMEIMLIERPDQDLEQIKALKGKGS